MEVAHLTDQPASEGIRHLLRELSMQSRRDSSTGAVILQKTSALSSVDFGEGEPYLDEKEKTQYLKKEKRSLNDKDNKRYKIRVMDDNEGTYGVHEDNVCAPNTNKRSTNKDNEKDKDSLDDGDEDDDMSASSSSNEEDEEVQKIEGTGKKVTRVQSVTERLTRDAMSLKRHQLREQPTKTRSRSDRARDDYRKRDREEPRSEDKGKQPKSKRDESRKRVGEGRKVTKGSHELYGEEYSTKYPLPPRSPTFSFRSTIDLLPSSHRRQGLRQQVRACLFVCLFVLLICQCQPFLIIPLLNMFIYIYYTF